MSSVIYPLLLLGKHYLPTCTEILECVNENEEDCEVQDNKECADEEDESNGEIQDMGSRDEEEYDLVAKKFADAFDCYKAEILRQHAQNSQDPSMNKAMMAITKNMNKSITLTLQKQMHNFTVGTVGKSRSKHGGVIKVNPPSLARQTFKVPGKGPAPLGHPMMNRAGKKQMFVTDNEDIFCKI